MDNPRPIAARKRMVAAGGLDPSSSPKTEFPLTAQNIPSRSRTTAPVRGPDERVVDRKPSWR